MKNFYIDTKFLSLLILMLWSLSLIGSLGCSSIFSNAPREVQVVTAYQSMGATLEEAKPAILNLCATGTLKDADCVKAKAAYNQAVTIYKTMAKAADLAVDTGDDTNLRAKTLRLQELLVIINQFIVTQ